MTGYPWKEGAFPGARTALSTIAPEGAELATPRVHASGGDSASSKAARVDDELVSLWCDNQRSRNFMDLVIHSEMVLHR